MKKLICAVVMMLLCYSSTFAVGALYARRPLSNDEGTPLWLKEYDATVTITDQIAVTHVDHVFKNESSRRLEGIFVFPLPNGAVVTELALWINGQRVVGDVMEKDTARAIYEGIVRRSIDPALLEYLGDNLFKVSVFPIEANGNAMSERRIEITYAELLPYSDKRVPYTFFMKTANLSSKPVERASISGSITSKKKITSFACPSHKSAIVLAQQDDFNATFVYGNENTHEESDLHVDFVFEEESFGLNHLVYNPDMKNPMPYDVSGDNGYFLLWVTPPNSYDESERLPKNVALVADVSSSMTGTRIVQLRKSLSAMVDMLTEKDAFSIVTFSSGVETFKSDMVKATAANREAAQAYIASLSEAGMTNYEDALRKALNSTFTDSTVNVVVFFTDGKPTWPVETSPTRILTQVKDLNTKEVSIFTFGVGNDLDERFLESLALQNGGAYYAITSDGAITSILSGFMNRIAYPLLKDITINYGSIDQYDVFPRPLPDLFAGTQLSVLGRFRTGGTSSIGVGATQAANEIAFGENLDFSEAQENHPFVPRMWASAKIDYLLGEITLMGEQDELVNNVKELGKKYGIVTPYTSMLVIEPEENPEEDDFPITTIENKLLPVPQTYSFGIKNIQKGRVTLLYGIPAKALPQHVVLRIFNAQGKLVRRLVNEVTGGGNYLVHWDCRTESGVNLSSGCYIAILEAGNSRQMVKIQLMR